MTTARTRPTPLPVESEADGKLLRDVEDGNEDDLEHKKFVPLLGAGLCGGNQARAVRIRKADHEPGAEGSQGLLRRREAAAGLLATRAEDEGLVGVVRRPAVHRLNRLHAVCVHTQLL